MNTAAISKDDCAADMVILYRMVRSSHDVTMDDPQPSIVELNNEGTQTVRKGVIVIIA